VAFQLRHFIAHGHWFQSANMSTDICMHHCWFKRNGSEREKLYFGKHFNYSI